MKSIYHADSNSMKEQGELERPNELDFPATSHLYFLAMQEYNAHISSLRTIQCDESCKGKFEDGKEYIEGVHYEESSNEDRLHRAYPLQPVEDENWPTLFLLIHMNAQDYKDVLGNNHPGLPNDEQWHKNMIIELKKHFTLTRK